MMWSSAKIKAYTDNLIWVLAPLNLYFIWMDNLFWNRALGANQEGNIEWQLGAGGD